MFVYDMPELQIFFHHTHNAPHGYKQKMVKLATLEYFSQHFSPILQAYHNN